MLIGSGTPILIAIYVGLTISCVLAVGSCIMAIGLTWFMLKDIKSDIVKWRK